jgi:hypothetical protein
MPDNNKLKTPFKAICVDDANRPQEIPPHKWVKKGQRYTVNKTHQSLSDGGLGFEIDSLGLDDSNYPYNSISARRFAIPMENIEADAEEAVNELMEELKPQTA